MITIGIPLYNSFDSLDVLGPFQVFTVSGMKPILLGEKLDPRTKKPAPVTSYEGVQIIPNQTFDAIDKVDVLFVPGGTHLGDIIADQVRSGHPLPPGKNPLLAFIDRIAGPKAKTPPKLITSVCTGALFLAAAGLLRGYRATTHWNYKSTLALFPGIEIADGYPRYIIDSNRVTGGGISSGIDEAFAITALLLGPQAAKRSQLLIQYAPNPPYNDGDPSVADPTVLHEVSTDMRDDATTQAFTKYVHNWGK